MVLLVLPGFFAAVIFARVCAYEWSKRQPQPVYRSKEDFGLLTDGDGH